MLHVYNEIGKLKSVLLHPPGDELNNLTPTYLGELLFDDIPWLPLAKKEHLAFEEAFKAHGVKVYHLLDLVAESLLNEDIKKAFIEDYLKDTDIKSETLLAVIEQYLLTLDNLELVKKCASGIKKNELPSYSLRTLFDYTDKSPFICNPMPNLYFTRDPFASIGSYVAINKMMTKARRRETIFAKYIFAYHPLFKDNEQIYTRDELNSIEGGDILIINKETLIIGVSERTSADGLSKLAKNIFAAKNTFKQVLAFTIPTQRTFMHLDTIFTQVDYDKFMIHKGALDNLDVYLIEQNKKQLDKLVVTPLEGKLEDILEHYIGKKITLIPCGGDDEIDSAREQWSDGSNCIALEPGVVICYERNEISNKILESYGIKVIRIPSSELSRGRGGPRCMSMPLEREDI